MLGVEGLLVHGLWQGEVWIVEGIEGIEGEIWFWKELL